MPGKTILLCGVALLVILPGTAMAGHGKPGLWTITTVMKMPDMPQMPPQVMEMMKKRGIALGGPMTSQMCMTDADVKMDKPPAVNNREMNCTTRIVSQSSNSVTSEAVCHGRMEGTGRSQVSWRGDDHYEGSYNFKGTMAGHSQESSSTFKGDWVKADCGAVKPFSAAAIPSTRPAPPR